MATTATATTTGSKSDRGPRTVNGGPRPVLRGNEEGGRRRACRLLHCRPSRASTTMGHEHGAADRRRTSRSVVRGPSLREDPNMDYQPLRQKLDEERQRLERELSALRETESGVR